MRSITTALVFSFALLALLACVLGVSADAGHVVELNLDLVDSPQEPDSNVSSISILSDEKYVVEQGSNITIPLSVYRGKTLKRTIYTWIRDSKGRRVSSKDKFPLKDRFTHYDLDASFGFSGCDADGDYEVFVEGLGLEQVKEVSLLFKGCEEEEKTVKVPDSKVSYEVLDCPAEVRSGMPFKVRVVMRNPTDEDLEVDVWSYVYRHSVCYSGEREQNRRSVNLPSFSNVTFDLENTVDADTEAGEYMIKIRFLRSDRKTEDDITLPLGVAYSSEDAKKGDSVGAGLSVAGETGPGPVDGLSEPKTERKLFSSPNTSGNSSSGTVFMSSSARAGNLAVYFIILVLALVLVALVMKRL